MAEVAGDSKERRHVVRTESVPTQKLLCRRPNYLRAVQQLLLLLVVLVLLVALVKLVVYLQRRAGRRLSTVKCCVRLSSEQNMVTAE